jgi:iron complex outermembrane receptor protein
MHSMLSLIRHHQNRSLALALALVAACSSTPSLLAQAVGAKNPEKTEEAIKLEAFKVTDSSELSGYGVSSFSSATRLKTAIMDIPQTVSVVTSALMRDIGAYDHAQAVAYIPNVSYRQNVNDGSVIRGFPAFNSYRNGFRMSGYVSDNFSLDRIEIVKGPAAAIAGSTESGGLVNRITKKPLEKKTASIGTTVGSYGFLRGELDMGGPITADSRKLTYRLVTAYQRGGGWRDFEDGLHKFSVNPSVNWRISERTNLLVEAEYLDAVTTSNEANVYLPFVFDATSNPLPNPSGATPKISLTPRWAPVTLNTNDRKLEGRVQRVENLFLTFTHAFTDNLSFRQNLMRQMTDIDTPKARPNPGQYIGTDGFIYQTRPTYQLSYAVQNLVTAQGDLALKYNVLGGSHQTLAGYEWNRTRVDSQLSQGSIGDLNIFQPNNDMPLGAPVLLSNQVTRNRSIGYFANHQSKFWKDRIIVTAGLRRDIAAGQKLEDRRNNRTVISPDPQDIDSPMYGLTLKPTRTLALYAVKSEAGAPTSQVPVFGSIGLADPRQQFFSATPKRINEEFGIKTELLNGKVSASLARFDIVALDAVFGIFDTTAPGGGRNYLQGGNRAKGWELEFFGSPLTGVTLTGGYARMESSVVDRTTVKANPELPGVPRHKFMTFVSYDLRGKRSDGFRIKGGLTYQTSMVGRVSNNYRIAGGFIIDLGADYTFGRWNLALNVNNVTDEILPSFGIGQPSNNVSPPRNFLLSLRRQF